MKAILQLLLCAAPLAAQLNVGIYSRMSEARPEYRRVAAAFSDDPHMRVTKLRAADIAAGALDRMQVLVMTGEAESAIDLGDLGREQIRKFVARGGLEISSAKNARRVPEDRLAAVGGLREALARLERKQVPGQPVARQLPAAGKTIRVAIYDDGGIGDAEAGLIMQGNLRLDRGIESTIVGVADILGGVLDRVDAVIFPGGTGSGTGRALGEEGREKVRAFVARGGAYLGFCAGAYLGSAHYPWSLHLINAGSADADHWARGGALSEVRVEPLARKIFPELGDTKSVFQVYWQGPMLVEGEEKNLPGFEVPFRFVSDIHHRQPGSKGVTPGKPWMALSPESSKVRVLLSSGHPESTPGSRYMVPRMVRWLTRHEVVSYGEYMNPRQFRAEMMFDKAWSARRDADVAALAEGADPATAEKSLRSICDQVYAAQHFVPGFLRSRHARLRQVAAELIVEMQMFWTDRDLEVALARETDPAARAAIAKALAYVRPAR